MSDTPVHPPVRRNTRAGMNGMASHLQLFIGTSSSTDRLCWAANHLLVVCVLLTNRACMLCGGEVRIKVNLSKFYRQRNIVGFIKLVLSYDFFTSCPRQVFHYDRRNLLCISIINRVRVGVGGLSLLHPVDCVRSLSLICVRLM